MEQLHPRETAVACIKARRDLNYVRRALSTVEMDVHKRHTVDLFLEELAKDIDEITRA